MSTLRLADGVYSVLVPFASLDSSVIVELFNNLCIKGHNNHAAMACSFL